MNRSIEQSLTSLIPRHNGSLPPQLIDLASSLLAQSRNKASNLKADEEIGRTYACANIACERLKTTLNLPKIEQRPPIPPRVYQKLYSYLDGILTGGRKRGRPPLSSANTPAKKQRTAGTVQPGSERSILQFHARTPKKSLLVSNNTERRAQIPKWIVPTIRLLCKELQLKRAYPHILAGVESILTSPSPVTTDSKQGTTKKTKREGKTPALVAAVYMFVRTRLLSKQTTGKEYSQQRKTVIDILARAGDDVEKVDAADVDAWLLELSEDGWLEMDWFQEIEEGSGVREDDAAVEEEFWSETKSTNRGLGTMMQDRVDYLSPDKRIDYKQWKAIMVAKIDELINKRHLSLPEDGDDNEMTDAHQAMRASADGLDDQVVGEA